MTSRPSPLCLTCSPGTYVAKTKGRTPKWLRDQGKTTAVPEHISRGLSLRPTLSIRCRAPRGVRDGKIFWWAAQSRRLRDAHRLRGPKEAYGAYYPNRGFGTVRDGVLRVRVESPQPYLEAGRLWTPHVHFIGRDDRGDWRTRDVYTVAALPMHHDDAYVAEHVGPSHAKSCCVTTTQVRQALPGPIWTLNALGSAHGCIHASGARHAPLALDHTRATPAALRRLRALVGRDPVVVYCAHAKCNAASRLMLKLQKAGFANLFYMPAGLRGWRGTISRS